MKALFNALYQSATEEAVNNILHGNSIFHDPSNWHPYGDNESNFSVVENQQSNPVAALIEKLTNSIDALLMKKCYEAGIVPNSADAPKTMDEAVKKFYVYENLDLQQYRSEVAGDIQILADPNIIIRDVTERPEIIECGSTMLAGVEPKAIIRAVKTTLARKKGWLPPTEYLDDNVSDKIVRIILGVGG